MTTKRVASPVGSPVCAGARRCRHAACSRACARPVARRHRPEGRGAPQGCRRAGEGIYQQRSARRASQGRCLGCGHPGRGRAEGAAGDAKANSKLTATRPAATSLDKEPAKDKAFWSRQAEVAPGRSWCRTRTWRRRCRAASIRSPPTSPTATTHCSARSRSTPIRCKSDRSRQFEEGRRRRQESARGVPGRRAPGRRSARLAAVTLRRQLRIVLRALEG